MKEEGQKRHYEAPSTKVLWMDTRNSLLAGSVVNLKQDEEELVRKVRDGEIFI